MSVRGKNDAADFDEDLGVLVVGAGPTGLTLAAQLDALGATVRVVGRQLDRVRSGGVRGCRRPPGVHERPPRAR
ncbi:MAG: FAD-dependent monooxygenase [Gaiellaceae bacterium]